MNTTKYQEHFSPHFSVCRDHYCRQYSPDALSASLVSHSTDASGSFSIYVMQRHIFLSEGSETISREFVYFTWRIVKNEQRSARSVKKINKTTVSFFIKKAILKKQRASSHSSLWSLSPQALRNRCSQIQAHINRTLPPVVPRHELIFHQEIYSYNVTHTDSN